MNDLIVSTGQSFLVIQWTSHFLILEMNLILHPCESNATCMSPIYVFYFPNQVGGSHLISNKIKKIQIPFLLVSTIIESSTQSTAYKCSTSHFFTLADQKVSLHRNHFTLLNFKQQLQMYTKQMEQLNSDPNSTIN